MGRSTKDTLQRIPNAKSTLSADIRKMIYKVFVRLFIYIEIFISSCFENYFKERKVEKVYLPTCCFQYNSLARD